MAILLFAFWLILNGRFDWDVILTGAVMTVILSAFAFKFCAWSFKKEKLLILGSASAFMYIVALLGAVIRSALTVLGLIFSGGAEPYVRTFRTPLKSRLMRVALANSITLTPGTVTMELVGDRLTVHCLTKRMADGVAGSALEARLKRMEDKLYGKRV